MLRNGRTFARKRPGRLRSKWNRLIRQSFEIHSSRCGAAESRSRQMLQQPDVICNDVTCSIGSTGNIRGKADEG